MPLGFRKHRIKSGSLALLAAGLLAFGLTARVNAQSTPSSLPLPDMAGNTLPLNVNRSGIIQVYVRTEDGQPLSSTPKVTIITPSQTAAIPQMQKVGDDVWLFNGAEIGTIYEIQVQASGYHTELRPARVLDSANASLGMIIFMRSPNDELAFHPPSGHFVLSPEAEKEAQKGATDLDSGKLDSAQKHLNKALGLAPGNPYLNYLVGMRFLLNGQLPAAKSYLEKSVAGDARQAPALRALGSLRFQQGDYAGATQVLIPAARLDPSNWRIHSMLAGSYLKEKDFEHAREEAEQSLKMGGSEAQRDQLVLGEALAALDRRPEAITALQAFLKQYPHDGNDAAIRAWLPSLKAPEMPALPPVSLTVASNPTLLDLPPRENWAPPDIDQAKPFTISGTSCALPKVLAAAGKSAAELVTDLQQFTAKEKYESVEIKRDQALERPETGTFNYLVFIENPRPDVIDVQEIRDQGVNALDMPGQFADSDAALALVFHPILQDDFSWSCEGLGEWQDRPAWIVRFEQRSDRPNRLATFKTGINSFSLPLKGRAWIAESGGQVMHLEVDLEKPLSEIKLEREHFIIDYSPVPFAHHKVTLWLPENVDVYLQYRGHYLHHYHHFSDFKLFWTGATQKIGQPKGLPKKTDGN